MKFLPSCDSLEQSNLGPDAFEVLYEWFISSLFFFLHIDFLLGYYLNNLLICSWENYILMAHLCNFQQLYPNF